MHPFARLIVITLVVLINNVSVHKNALAEDKTSEAVHLNTSSTSDGENPLIKMNPINVIGIKPEQAPKPGASTLKGRALRLQQNDTLGQTLSEELGVSNASFGPGVGIPVIRGLTGSRVRILQNGIGTHDATSLSPDHALAIDTLFANEIKVLRGPETIRYGGGAIGGIVDVSDDRIPQRRAKETVSGTIESRYNTNANGTHSAFTLNTGKDRLALNLGGFFRDRNDIRIPGKAIDEAFAVQQLGLTEISNASGKIPNTDNKSIGGFTGLSWLGDQVMAGMSVSHTDNRYGIPRGSHHLDPNHLDGLETILPRLDDIAGFEDIFGPQALFPNIRVNMRQTRYDFKSEWYEPIQGIDSISFRYGLVDYGHTEFEGGLPFTRFNNKAGEGRVEMQHNLLHNLSGTFGLQWIDRKFSALGVETFVPETKQLSIGLYTTQTYTLNNWSLQGGLRFEHSQVNPKENELKLRGSALSPVPLPDSLDFQAISASLGLQWNPRQDFTATLTYNHGVRPPDIQELFSFGPHLSTRSFDIGNVQLKNETVNMIDLGFEWKTARASMRINGYYNRTSDFIYQRNTGLFYEVDNEVIRQRCVSVAQCVSMFAYDQRSAEFIGYESSIDATLYQLPQGNLSLTLFSDYVRGRFVNNDRSDVPRMPPLRYGSELGFGNPVWNMALRYTRAEEQPHPGTNETSTRGYHLLTVSADYQLKANQWMDLWFFAKGYNLLNEEIRNSVSFLRNFAPEPGRSFILGVRATF
ncbi:iron complex outermembrane recepter protein [Nitrosomonas aestuarii]|uniref:Iron complex outermembrane recepter protein n=2 Tax=Nitrosomonas aestuarii TaxID=52441 RepID=A0A1I4GIX1_9PROT|nr:iron complex outermembrane recepter protein [Nitrosomonas aestuarii]